MAIQPKYKAGGTARFVCTPYDDKGENFVPSELTWSLYRHGQIVNGREDVVVNIPGDFYEDQDDGLQKTDILLQGDDLIGGSQYLVLQGRYTSDAGSDLPLNEWHEVPVEYPPWERY